MSRLMRDLSPETHVLNPDTPAGLRISQEAKADPALGAALLADDHEYLAPPASPQTKTRSDQPGASAEVRGR